MQTMHPDLTADHDQADNAAAKRRLTVGVLLSSREQFSAYYGGALARWTYEVYSRLSDQVAVSVFGFPTSEEDQYPLPHETSSLWRACAFLSRIPRARRWEEPLWLRALIGRLRPLDVLHIHNRPQWVVALRRLGYRGSIILHLQNNHIGHWSTADLDALSSRLDGLAVCSAFLRGTFAERSPSLAAKTEVVFNGVNTQLFYPREEIRERKTVFFVGRFDEQKGVLQLVQAYAVLLDRHPDAVLVIGGTTGFGVHRETSYVGRVRTLAQSLVRNKGAQILFPGYIHHDRSLPGWFQRATLCASPSIFEEPFGLVNAEAMACGTPVVGSNRGGIPEVLGTDGLLVNPEDTHALASAIAGLLDQPDKRAQLGRAACERARAMFDWSVIAEHWMSFLQEACTHREEHCVRQRNC